MGIKSMANSVANGILNIATSVKDSVVSFFTTDDEKAAAQRYIDILLGSDDGENKIPSELSIRAIIGLPPKFSKNADLRYLVGMDGNRMENINYSNGVSHYTHYLQNSQIFCFEMGGLAIKDEATAKAIFEVAKGGQNLDSTDSEALKELTNSLSRESTGRFYNWQPLAAEYFNAVSSLCHTFLSMLGDASTDNDNIYGETLNKIKRGLEPFGSNLYNPMAKLDKANASLFYDKGKLLRRTLGIYSDDTYAISVYNSAATGDSITVSSEVGPTSAFNALKENLTQGNSAFQILSTAPEIAHMLSNHRTINENGAERKEGVWASLMETFTGKSRTTFKMNVPEVWKSSSYGGKEYTIAVILQSVSKDLGGVYYNVLEKLAMLMAMALPANLDNSVGIYSPPFVIKGYTNDGIYISMGMVTSITISRDPAYIVRGLPTRLDVTLTVKDLWNNMGIPNGPTRAEVLKTAGLNDFMGSMCGYNTTSLEMLDLENIKVIGTVMKAGVSATRKFREVANFLNPTTILQKTKKFVVKIATNGNNGDNIGISK